MLCACGLEVAPYGVERGADGTRKSADCDHDKPRNHCEDDAVLGHRLTLLDVEACAEVSDQICERHDGFTPFLRLERARRARYSGTPGVEIDSNYRRIEGHALTSFLG